LLLPFAIADADVKAEWLSDRRGKKVEILVPARGPRHDLVELARKNAAASFASRRNTRDDAQATLGRLQRRLGLPRLPRVIECYDISHIQGAETVASLVVFVDGQPEKSRYRTYKIRQAESPDDFACMYEVLSRRFRRARASMQQEKDWIPGVCPICWSWTEARDNWVWHWQRRATPASTYGPAQACPSLL